MLLIFCFQRALSYDTGTRTSYREVVRVAAPSAPSYFQILWCNQSHSSEREKSANEPRSIHRSYHSNLVIIGYFSRTMQYEWCQGNLRKDSLIQISLGKSCENKTILYTIKPVAIISPRNLFFCRRRFQTRKFAEMYNIASVNHSTLERSANLNSTFWLSEMMSGSDI